MFTEEFIQGLQNSPFIQKVARQYDQCPIPEDTIDFICKTFGFPRPIPYTDYPCDGCEASHIPISLMTLNAKCG
ncbi:MAG: hypothetical protein C7B43_14320 [Sulfobacillus benefaciens]|jgi:hypothetical protein|uniref:Uncharacterized protein n=1 Tax=Sulfobacillus benefaciens TaxID=453960 RepID=A0A2T2WVL7_9FIRM|nr:MAG: hypothetical protein C7B43_14320 [Sulfobacillus benefaciens]HBQ95167.1 hypothetical protein [Sulfobacillus sp.]